MAAAQRPVATTFSRCVPNAVRGRHLFEVSSYSLNKGLGPGTFIQSAVFSVGGHDWCVVYYPEGDGTDGSDDYVSIFLKHVMSNTTSVTQLAPTMVTTVSSAMPPSNRVTADFSGVNPCWGLRKFMQKCLLVGYLQDDRLMIECDVTVIKGRPVLESQRRCKIQVPPSNLLENLGILLETGEGADVTFKVEEVIFHAHKVVLGIQSPVFKAELYGLLEDMQPAIFKALLYFMYTDLMPDISNVGGEEREEMVKHLLVAADRYGVDRMKVMCESVLAQRLDVKSVAATLALADQYNCSKLRESCIDFINSLNSTEDLQASEGYAHLKRASPDIIMEIWEKGTKFRKT
ncbi:hypothetical protein HU200_061154 [Digitaria exilis]|uniref:Speckle-type POZ protein n=1 Tax=Digitaria exilis TaxID=1010633 RepID=A0A835AAZ7_9POAL|nr:hypothetical protein HU200_061154 [Digitaria exilis]